jgi:DNA polymerase-1
LEYHPFVAILQEHRRLAKIKGTYVEKLIELADENSRVHVNYNIHGTETGRLSANDGLHGIPRPSDIWGQALRGSFVAKEGYKLVMCDYSGGELRIFAALSGERFLLDMFNNDDDPHGIITLMCFGDDPRFAGMTRDSWDKQRQKWIIPQIEGYTQQDQENYWKETRTTGKNVVFGGLVYMGGASGICAMIRAQTGKIISQDVVSHVLKTTLAQMPQGVAWQRQQFRFARDNGYVQNRFGFKRRFLLITDENLDEVKKAAVNAPIQGSLSQLTMLSGIQLTNEGYKVLMYNHDQIICEVPEHLAETAAKHIQSVMIEKATDYFQEVRWRADVEIGNRWYDNRPSFSKEVK